MYNKLLSIIVAVYNAEDYLNRCVDSILKQDYQNYELILVDDGSTDNSYSICEEYSKKNSRIRVFHKDNEGCFSAWNRGLNEAKGEIIGFVDNDDIIDPKMYSVLIQNMDKYGADISVCGRYRCVDGILEPSSKENITHVYSRDEALYELFAVTKRIRPAVWDKIYKTEIFKELRFENTYFEDAALTYLLVSNVNKVVYTEAQLYQYSVHGNSMITKPWGNKQLESYYYINRCIDEYFLNRGEKDHRINSIKWKIEFSIEAYERLSNNSEISPNDIKAFLKHVSELCQIKNVFFMSIPLKKKIRFLLFPYIPRFTNKILGVKFRI